MSMQQALERSVLERKERDELAAIAEAMGVKPASRASKATLIDTILREAGIETGAEERPKRPRTRSTASRNGAAAKAEKAETNEPASAGTADAETGSGEAEASAAQESQASAAEDSGASAPTVNGEAKPSEAVADAADSAPAPDQGAATGTEAPAPSGEAKDQPADASTRSEAATGEAATSEPAAAEAASDETSSNGARQGANTSTTTPAPAQGHRPDQREHREQREQRDQRGPRDQREQRDQRDQRDQRFEGQGGGDPGNRRSRRRRGRDRGERDIQQDRSQDQQYSGELVPAEGLLDLRDEGYGFLRTGGYLASSGDAYVSLSQVRRFALRKGDYVQGASRPAGSNEKYPALLRIDTVNGMTPDEARTRPRFEDLTPLFPDEKLRLEVAGDSNNMISRIVDLVSPIGKGQRGLIVSPPKAGKTTVLKQIAHSIEANNPDVKLMVLLVDERPEEVTDFRRSVKGGEVVASTFDRPSDEHAQVAELTLERAKRMVELGNDVVIVLDGITRLSRAYNLAAPATGRIMSGGLDVNALYPPKRFFGAARNIEEGGSLTILATALVETGSKMDEVIFEEFKGTGNMELKLDRNLAERRIYPALDVNASSTRHEELLFDRGQLPQVWKLRRVLNALEPGAGLELLMDKIKTTKSNDEFLAEIAKAPVPSI